jgi:hypothetical protein
MLHRHEDLTFTCVVSSLALSVASAQKIIPDQWPGTMEVIKSRSVKVCVLAELEWQWRFILVAAGWLCCLELYKLKAKLPTG